jgi:transcriptional regulator with XRE-family HTH domain
LTERTFFDTIAQTAAGGLYMELNERIALIIKENHLKQKELAALIGVTESYISTLLSGRNKKISNSVANLIEEKLGYNAQWLLFGTGEKLKQISKNPNLSEEHRRAIMQLEKMPDDQIKAVLAFIDSLEKIESAFSDKENLAD